MNSENQKKTLLPKFATTINSLPNARLKLFCQGNLVKASPTQRWATDESAPDNKKSRPSQLVYNFVTCVCLILLGWLTFIELSGGGLILFFLN